MKMSGSSAMRCYTLPIIGFLMMVFFRVTQAQLMDPMAPSPAPFPPSNDSTALDQGIAYLLLVVALAVTYLVH